MDNPEILNRIDFPFQVKANLKPFIDHWRTVAAVPNSIISGETVDRVEKVLREFPELTNPTSDIRLFEPHQEFLDLLFAHVLPSEGFNNSIEAITSPFAHYPPIKATQSYHNISKFGGSKFNLMDLAPGVFVNFHILYAYKYILKKFYNFDLNVDQPVLTSLFNAESGLSRYYKLTGHLSFVDVIPQAPLPKLDQLALRELLDRQYDSKIWAYYLPPENFLFTGLSFVTLMDVTIEQAVARIQRHLLNSPDEIETTWFNNLRKEIQNLFRLQGLHMGIATIQRNGELNFTSKNPLWNSLLLRELFDDPRDLVKDSIYEDILTKGKTVIIEDLNKGNKLHHNVTKAIIQAGYNNLLFTPIHYGGRLIGILEFASPKPGDINGLSLFKINQIKPIFSVALYRLLEEFENRVEAIMMHQYTSIHPAIEWRFREAAIHLLYNKENGAAQQEIIFENIYPFYGSLDIRDSSKKRNKAVERDLLFNIHAALDILRYAYETLSFDILGQLISDIERCRDKINDSFSSGDEDSIAAFIRSEINPVIKHLYKQYPQLIDANPLYRDTISSESGICTQYKMGYENAINLVTNCISNCLDAEEADLQRLYPCYFEKYKTDGVEYNIYTGSAIAHGRELDPLYLDNLRLRQLLWTSKIVKEITILQPQLHDMIENNQGSDDTVRSISDSENSVEIAPLILAYGSPITLKFRSDEKRLDVDGSYNVRYAVLKKRIDKATIRGGSERLTQPGHISIVFTQEQEAVAYERHLQYLAGKGIIFNKWERFDLESMQGVEGLKALRAKVVIRES